MVKQLSIFAALSVVLVFFSSFAQKALIYLDLGYAYINVSLSNVFSTGTTGIKIHKITTLMLLPLMLAGIPAMVYWFFKHQVMPYFYHILWVAWLIILVSHIMIR